MKNLENQGFCGLCWIALDCLMAETEGFEFVVKVFVFK